MVLIEVLPFVQWMEREGEERKGGEREGAGGVHGNTTLKNTNEVLLVGLTRKEDSGPLGGERKRGEGEREGLNYLLIIVCGINKFLKYQLFTKIIQTHSQTHNSHTLYY